DWSSDVCSSDLHVRAHGRQGCTGAAVETQRGAAGVLVDPDAAMIQVNPPCAQPFPHGLVQDTMELAAVNADLGPGVAGMPAARLPVDELAVPVEEDAFE